uniref:Uncharacterized protein n=1 Tax=Dunaliella tertiolecta TaxID=3047 RepID=A0A7S3R2T8_DUNTE|mmetsp:Transcript_22864/g.59765  ORF Transcript_22864/g.59765 Transcript_22864/m.59765 type:complete len:116 (+) Transcript_22864:239-586(+)
MILRSLEVRVFLLCVRVNLSFALWTYFVFMHLYAQVEESKQLNTVDSQQRSSKGGKNGPLGQPSSQDKSPEALAAELGIPVASKSVKRGSLQRGSAAKAKETKQEMAAQMEAMME